jgi:hypothetical protein
LLSAAEFKEKCGVDIGSSAVRRPSVEEIETMVQSWLSVWS